MKIRKQKLLYFLIAIFYACFVNGYNKSEKHEDISSTRYPILKGLLLVKDEKDPERLNQFDTVKNSGETLLSIINDILDLSKIESGKMEIEKNPIDIKRVLNDTIAKQMSLSFD